MTICQEQHSFYIEELNTKFPNLQSTLSYAKQTTIVEAFLYNYPLPKIVLLESDYQQYDFLEGKEIVAALLDFYKNKFRLDNPIIFKDINLCEFMSLNNNLKDKFTKRRISTTVMLIEDKCKKNILKIKNKLIDLYY